MLTGKTLTLQCTAGETILEFKHRIEDKEGCPPDTFHVVFGGKQLLEDAKLKECQMHDGCTVHVLPRLRGC
jgi:hypothetical protein